MNQHEVLHHTLPGFGTTVLIDGFRFAKNTQVFFLTHFHSDHYGGLDSRFPFCGDGDASGATDTVSPKIYCSNVTGDLVVHALGVAGRYVMRLPFDSVTRVTVTLHGVERELLVTLVSANHCPGAAMLLFHLPSNPVHERTVLHTGDMRYDSSMKRNLHLRAVAGGHVGPMLTDSAGAASSSSSPLTWAASGDVRIDEVLLDTTYSHPKHTFMRQEESIDAAVDVVRAVMPPGPAVTDGWADTDRTLVLVSTYVVGKERILAALADRLRLRVYAPKRKYDIIDLLRLPPATMEAFTYQRLHASVHVVGMGMCGRASPYFQPDFTRLHNYLLATNRMHAAPSVPLAAVSSTPAGNARALITNAEAAADEEDELEEAAVAAAAVAPTDVAGSARYTRVIGIVPTGWVHSAKRKVHSKAAGEVDSRTGAAFQFPVDIHLIPYSEHSSFDELLEFVRFLRPRKVTPTVFSDDAHRLRILQYFTRVTDETAAKRVFLQGFQRVAAAERASAARVSDSSVSSPGSNKRGREAPVEQPSDPHADASDIVDLSEDAVVSEAPVRHVLVCHACSARSAVHAGALQCPACSSDFVEVQRTAAARSVHDESLSMKPAGTAAAPAAAPGRAAGLLGFFQRQQSPVVDKSRSSTRETGDDALVIDCYDDD